MLGAVRSATGSDAELLVDLALQPAERWQDKLAAWIDFADAVVILVTPAYLQSSYVRETELPRLLHRAASGLKMFWIHLAEAQWRATGLAEYQAVNDVGHPLVELSEAAQAEEVERIARLIATGVGLSVTTAGEKGGLLDAWSRLSPSSRHAIVLANAHRRAGSQDRVHMEHLVAGLQGGKPDAPMAQRLRAAGIGTTAELGKILTDANPQHYLVSPGDIPTLESLPELSAHAAAALLAAAALAKRQGTRQIHSRQLTYGALSIEACSVIDALGRHGVRNEVPPAVDEGNAADIPSLPPSQPLDVTHSRLAGFSADTTLAKDSLAVGREALTLAMLVAHHGVKPPISVGLFGDWGSGKSFFMRQMRDWIERLSRESSDRNGAYCRRIIQLDFNAWHYIDGNLWASLAREIFEGLANAVADKEAPELRFKRLREATQSTKDLIACREADVRTKQAQLTDAEQRLRVITVPTEAQIVAASARAALEVPEIGDRVRDVAGALHLPVAGKTLGELKKQAGELSGLVKTGKALVLGFRSRWYWVFIGVGVVAAMYGGLFIARMYGLDYVMGRTVAWLAGAATVAAPILAKARTILGRIKDFQRSIDTELQRNREAKQRELTADADAKRTEVVALQMQLKHSRDELGTLNEELRGLQATQQMVNFIRQRDASTDYRSQLGVIARAHQDFRRLSELMEQVHTQAVSPGGRRRVRGPSPPSTGSCCTSTIWTAAPRIRSSTCYRPCTCSLPSHSSSWWSVSIRAGSCTRSSSTRRRSSSRTVTRTDSPTARMRTGGRRR